MYSVTPVFTQVMDFMSLKTFQRCVERYRGNFGVKNFTCLDQFRTRGFAQLTYRESLPSSTKQKTLSPGHPQQGFPQHSGGSERDEGLAYLRRFRPSSDRHCQEALPEGTLRGTEEHGLRLGCYDDRPLPVYLSLGALPGNKGSRPTSYPAGSAGQYPELYPYHRRKNSRSQRAGYDPSGSRLLLHHGSRLPGLLQTPCYYSGIGVLRYPGQVEFEEPQDILPSCKQAQRRRLRSIRYVDRPELCQRLSRQDSPGEVLRCQNRQVAGVSDQQLFPARCHHRPALQMPLAGGALLQVDQTEPAHQELLRHFGKRREDPDLDWFICS